MPFTDNNVARGLPRGGNFKVGRANLDSGTVVESGVLIPWSSDPQASWLYYECSVGVMLDSGIVVHQHLPQVNRDPDTLASCFLDDPGVDKITDKGVNLTCRDQYADIVQRMGHARYWFRLWGRALRAGYQIPIPGMKTIGGVPAVPYDRNPQWAVCAIAPCGNYSGVPLWRAQWSLWYTTARPPTGNTVPAFDSAGHVSGSTALPTRGIQAPYGQPDDNAQRTGGPTGTGTVPLRQGR